MAPKERARALFCIMRAARAYRRGSRAEWFGAVDKCIDLSGICYLTYEGNIGVLYIGVYAFPPKVFIKRGQTNAGLILVRAQKRKHIVFCQFI